MHIQRRTHTAVRAAAERTHARRGGSVSPRFTGGYALAAPTIASRFTIVFTQLSTYALGSGAERNEERKKETSGDEKGKGN